MDPLIGSVTNSLAARWKSYVLGSVVFFWLLGAGILLLSRSDALRTVDCGKRHDLACWAHSNKSGGQVALLVLAVVVVVATAALLSAAADPVLALLAGRWPENALTRWRRAGLVKRRARAAERAAKRAAERDDPERRRYPAVRDTELAPTRMGNARTATNDRIEDAFGLDLATAWPILLALLPDEIYKRLASASATVRGRVQQWMLSLAAIGWLALIWTGHLRTTPRILWTAPFVLAWVLIAWITFRRVRSAAYEYFDLVESVVTAHRRLLYTGLGLTAPADSDAEPRRGREVSAYLNLDGGSEILGW